MVAASTKIKPWIVSGAVSTHCSPVLSEFLSGADYERMTGHICEQNGQIERVYATRAAATVDFSETKV